MLAVLKSRQKRGPKQWLILQRILDKSWKRARFTDDMACNLLDGLTRLRMGERYFTTIFEAYKAKERASGEQAAAIVRFERELSGGAGHSAKTASLPVTRAARSLCSANAALTTWWMGARTTAT